MDKPIKWYRAGYGATRYDATGRGLLFTSAGYLAGPSSVPLSARAGEEPSSMPEEFHNIRCRLVALAVTEPDAIMSGVLRSVAELYTD